MTDSTAALPTARQIALATVVVDIERTAAQNGWDHPPYLYALVPTKTLLDDPALPPEVKEQVRVGWDGSAEHLSAIIQDDLATDDLETTLACLAWPPQVAGVALTVERVVVPPDVEAQAPSDPQAALDFFVSHPTHTDVRLVVGVLRSGESWSAVRSRSHDSDEQVGQGSDLVPNLIDALAASLLTDSDEESARA